MSNSKILGLGKGEAMVISLPLGQILNSLGAICRHTLPSAHTMPASKNIKSLQAIQAICWFAFTHQGSLLQVSWWHNSGFVLICPTNKATCKEPPVIQSFAWCQIIAINIAVSFYHVGTLFLHQETLCVALPVWSHWIIFQLSVIKKKFLRSNNVWRTGIYKYWTQSSRGWHRHVMDASLL